MKYQAGALKIDRLNASCYKSAITPNCRLLTVHGAAEAVPLGETARVQLLGPCGHRAARSIMLGELRVGEHLREAFSTPGAWLDETTVRIWLTNWTSAKCRIDFRQPHEDILAALEAWAGGGAAMRLAMRLREARCAPSTVVRGEPDPSMVGGGVAGAAAVVK